MSNQTKMRGERYHSNVVSGCLSPCSWISNVLECSKFHLSIQVWINTSKNISEQGSSGCDCDNPGQSRLVKLLSCKENLR